MNGILNQLAQNLGGGQMTQLAQAIGADERQTQSAVAAALPAILGAMRQNAASPAGAQQLVGAVQQDHDRSLLANLGALLGGQAQGRAADGGGILGHILGGRRPQLEEGVAQASGLDLSQVARLLPLLAPIVMAALGRAQRQTGAGPDDLSQMLGRDAQVARQAAPDGLLGHLSGFLDRDGDGDVKDDLMAQAGRAALGQLFGRR